jgi:hypothetical protein
VSRLGRWGAAQLLHMWSPPICLLLLPVSKRPHPGVPLARGNDSHHCIKVMSLLLQHSSGRQQQRWPGRRCGGETLRRGSLMSDEPPAGSSEE